MEITIEEIKNLGEEKQIAKIESLPSIEKDSYIEAVGRRKRAVARVRIWQNNNQKEFAILINEKNYKDYFKDFELQKIIESPIKKIKAQKAYKLTIKVQGGGKKGQAEAIRLGIARALVLLNPEWKLKFKKVGFLTRDPREIERKKYGKRKARKREQWQKR